MHDIGCSRQNYKCKECNKCVAKSDKETHDSEMHKDIVCPDCAFSAPAFKYAGHEKNCKLRPKPCEFCDTVISHV